MKIILALLLMVSPVFAQTVTLPSLDEENLPVLNEELRKRADDVMGIQSDITTLQTAAGSIEGKIGTFTRDISSTGTQAITGVGFTPSFVIFFSSVTGQAFASFGMDDGTTHAAIGYDGSGPDWDVSTDYSIYLRAGAADTGQGVITTLGTDGFTVTWSKSGSPTGTATIIYFAIRGE